METYDSSSRQIPPKADVKEQAKTFRDLSQSLTEEQVKKETSRCLSCGASVVDPNKCIGCGVCTTKCMFDAIHLHREIPGASIMRASEDKLKYILPNMVKQSIKVKFKKKKQKLCSSSQIKEQKYARAWSNFSYHGSSGKGGR